MIQKLLILGGKGKMGNAFALKFREIGVQVRIVDKDDSEEDWLLSLHEYPLIILSVPIEHTPQIIKKIKPHLTPDQLLTDFTSVKEYAIPAMNSVNCSVISSHPLFGHNTGFHGQNVLLMPVKPGIFLQPLKKLYTSLGLRVFVIDDWKKHDQYMAYIQCLIHFIHITFAATMQKSGLDLELIDTICSPVYKAHLAFCGRILNRNPKLYSHIITDNPKSQEVIDQYLKISQDCFESVEQKDAQYLTEQLLDSQKHFGELTNEYEKISNYLVEKMSELKLEK